MAGDWGITIEGIEAAQAANQRAIQAVQPAGGLGRAVMYATTLFDQAVIADSPVDTGTLRGANAMDVQGPIGRVYIAPHINPKSHTAASKYGPIIHQRGGHYAFYGNAYKDERQRVGDAAAKIILGELE